METITRNYHFQSEQFFLIKSINKTFRVINPSCTADAVKAVAEHLKVDYDGLFTMDCKQISPEIKSHKKYFTTQK